MSITLTEDIWNYFVEEIGADITYHKYHNSNVFPEPYFELVMRTKRFIYRLESYLNDELIIVAKRKNYDLTLNCKVNNFINARKFIENLETQNAPELFA